MIARHDEHRDSGRSELAEGLERLMHQRVRHPWFVEHVPAVHHEVDIPGQGGGQRPQVVGEEVVTPSSAMHPGSRGMIDAEMTVGEEEHACLHATTLLCSAFVR